MEKNSDVYCSSGVYCKATVSSGSVEKDKEVNAGIVNRVCAATYARCALLKNLMVNKTMH